MSENQIKLPENIIKIVVTALTVLGIVFIPLWIGRYMADDSRWDGVRWIIGFGAIFLTSVALAIIIYIIRGIYIFWDDVL